MVAEKENTFCMEIIKGYPYKTIAGLAKEFGLCDKTVQTKLKGIRQLIADGRYNKYAVIADGKIVLINVYVFIDYLTFRKQLEDKNMAKYVQEFDPRKIAHMCGWEV